MKKQPNVLSQTGPVLIDPEDNLHASLEKAKSGVPPKQWVETLLEAFPPAKSSSSLTPEEEAEEDKLSATRFAERKQNSRRVY